MSKFAIVRIKGSQYKVSEGDEILIDKAGSADIVPEVLMVCDGDKVTIGKPLLDNKVGVKILKDVEKGNKVKVMKYKSKSRYRKTIGFRPKHTRLQVGKIA